MSSDWIDDYLLSKAGVSREFKEEWRWWRFLLKGKMVAARAHDKAGKKILTVKCEPALGEKLRENYRQIVPGYYMNKLHWNSVYVDDAVPKEVIKEMIDQSYRLILAKLPKKVQGELKEETKNG